MKQFRELLTRILQEGEPRYWRNGHQGIGVFDHQMKFDLRTAFPMLTLKHVPWKPVIGELCGFLSGATSAKDFRDLGCNVWNQNANEEPSWLANPHRHGEDDLGRIYSAQWCDYSDLRVITAPEIYQDAWARYGSKGFEHVAELSDGRLLIRRGINQIQELVEGLRNDPHGRRHVVSAWNPAEMDQMALPPCHMFFQCYASSDGQWLDLKMYQRSADVFLGIPFNIASYAALTHILARLTGRQARNLTMDLGDAHLYSNQIEPSYTVLTREDKRLPVLTMDEFDGFSALTPDSFKLVGYDPHPAIKVGMAV